MIPPMFLLIVRVESASVHAGILRQLMHMVYSQGGDACLGVLRAGLGAPDIAPLGLQANPLFLGLQTLWADLDEEARGFCSSAGPRQARVHPGAPMRAGCVLPGLL